VTPADFTASDQRAFSFARNAPNASQPFELDIRLEAGSTSLIREVMLASDLADPHFHICGIFRRGLAQRPLAP
jgi:hypothetical protein